MFPLFKFKVEGNSMTPAFNVGNMVLVNRFSYFFNRPKIGDVVVLKREKFMIKRIAKIKEKKFFIIGDNKEESIDSRSFGWIDRSEIVGKVIFKI